MQSALIERFAFHDAVSTSVTSYRRLIDVEARSCVYRVEEKYFKKIIVKHS